MNLDYPGCRLLSDHCLHKGGIHHRGAHHQHQSINVLASCVIVLFTWLSCFYRGYGGCYPSLQHYYVPWWLRPPFGIKKRQQSLRMHEMIERELQRWMKHQETWIWHTPPIRSKNTLFAFPFCYMYLFIALCTAVYFSVNLNVHRGRSKIRCSW